MLNVLFMPSALFLLTSGPACPARRSRRRFGDDRQRVHAGVVRGVVRYQGHAQSRRRRGDPGVGAVEGPVFAAGLIGHFRPQPAQVAGGIMNPVALQEPLQGGAAVRPPAVPGRPRVQLGQGQETVDPVVAAEVTKVEVGRGCPS